MHSQRLPTELRAGSLTYLYAAMTAIVLHINRIPTVIWPSVSWLSDARKFLSPAAC